MTFPELKIIVDDIKTSKYYTPSTNSVTLESEKMLTVSLDWSEKEKMSIDRYCNYFKKFCVPSGDTLYENALCDLLNESDWSNFNYPSKYIDFYNKYSTFKMSESYYNKCIEYKKMSIDLWERSDGFDTNVNEVLLEVPMKCVDVFFYLICDSIYINTLTNDNKALFYDISKLKCLLLYRFWKEQTGASLIIDRCLDSISYRNDEYYKDYKIVRKEIEDSLIFCNSYVPLVDYDYDGRKELDILVKEKIRDNKIKNILH